MENHIPRKKIIVQSIEQAGYILAFESPSQPAICSIQKRRLFEIENKLTKQFANSNLRDRHPDYATELINNLVTVEIRKRWVRGLVLGSKRSKSEIRLKVQLIDYCDQEWFAPEDLKLLPSRFNTQGLECQSMKIVLYGMEPASLKIDLSSRNKLIGNMHFYDKDIKFINEQFKEAQSIYFEEICRVEEFHFGDIILIQNNGSSQNLRNLLLQNYLAIEKPDFENHIPQYIKNFRRDLSTFDSSLAVRKLLFPSIAFSDVEQPTTRYRDAYYRSPPVDDETPENTESISSRSYSNSPHEYSSPSKATLTPEKTECNTSRRSSSNDLSESTSASTTETTLPAATLSDTEQSLDECSNLIDKIVVVTGGTKNCIQPVNSFRESPLDSETSQMLNRLQIRDMTRCQKYLVPAVLSGQNVTLIEGPGAGKTVGVLISLVSLMRRTAKEKESGLGARAIVVCPYSAQCELVEKNCFQIIQGRLRVTDTSGDPVTVNVAYGLGIELEEKNLIDLLKGYDILACTPKRLLRLLENEHAFDFDRLSHIVFDDANTLLTSYGNEIKRILDYVRRKPKLPQRIIISDQWMPELKCFIKEDIDYERGSLLVSSYKDAALFVRLKSIWTCIDSDLIKLKNITEMLNGPLELRNVVVVFSDYDKFIDTIYEKLKKDCCRPIYMIENFKRLNASDTVVDWQNDVARGRFPVLLCTDYALSNLQVYQADYLIHYSLPQSKTDFLLRFSVLLNRLQRVAEETLKPGQRRTDPRRRPEMCIYSNNKENDNQFPEIVKIMKQLNAVIPETDRMRNILRRKEMIKKEFDLCLNVKEFGRCHRESRCKFRHIVLQDDVPDKMLPLCGYIKTHIMYVYSATHYGVRILERANEPTGPWSPVVGLPHPHRICRQMSQHFLANENRKTRVHNEVGDIVAFERGEVHRVKIIKFPQADIAEENEERATPKRALVKFIDQGWEEEIPTQCLMELPTSLASIPPGIVDVFVCNLLPVDEDVAWGNKITKIVRNQLMNHQEKGIYYFTGKIELVLGRNIWLNSLRCEEVKAVFKEPITIFSVSKMLTKQQLAICHDGHLPKLRQLCEDAGLEQDHTTNADRSEENVDENDNDIPCKANADTSVEKIHPISNGHCEKNVSTKNVDIIDTPSAKDILSNEDKDEHFEINSPIGSGRSEKNMSTKNLDNVDTPSTKDIRSNKDKDAHFETIHSPISNDLFEKSVLHKKVALNNGPSDEESSSSHSIPSETDKPSKQVTSSQSIKPPNDGHMFKKPSCVVVNGGLNKLSSVSKETLKALKPQVEWRQNTFQLILNIAVNSDNFRVELWKAEDLSRRVILYFWAQMDDKLYEFKETLYSRARQPPEFRKSGVFICIKLTKTIPGAWPRLFRKTPLRWVRMDQNVDSSDDEIRTPAYIPPPSLPRDIRAYASDDTTSNSDSADDSDTGFGCDD